MDLASRPSGARQTFLHHSSEITITRDKICRQKDLTFFRPTAFGAPHLSPVQAERSPEGQRLKRVLSTGHPSAAFA